MFLHALIAAGVVFLLPLLLLLLVFDFLLPHSLVSVPLSLPLWGEEKEGKGGRYYPTGDIFGWLVGFSSKPQGGGGKNKK